jgi:outer membrane receptor for ferrienterochelin and colicins
MSETSHSFTGSYSKYFGLKNMELNTIVEGFYNNISNKIELIVTGPIQAQYGNIGVYQSVGGGVNQSIKVKDFRMNASFNYTGIFNGVDESQKEFFFSPQVVLQPSYKFKKTNTSVNLFFNYFGAVSRVFSDTASSAVNIQEQDAYSMFDITAGQLLMNKKMQLNVGVRNLLNVVNINSNTTEVGAHTPSTTFISVSPGRTFFISLRYEFSK